MVEQVKILVDSIISYGVTENNPDGFQVIRSVVNFYNQTGFSKNFHSVLFTLLEHREKFSKYNVIINSLLREIGLFPYIIEEEIDGFKESMTFNAFLAPEIRPDKTVFHFPQAKVFYTLMSGRSVILSAPTSFGKSLIIDTIISTKKFENIVIIVPTIALIDETRKRLNYFSPYYKIITHPNQKKSNKNIYVLTQERAVLDDFIGEVDFFIIDEFYKLSPQGLTKEDSRCDILNIAFYKLFKKCNLFYMLGPNIDGLVSQVDGSISYIFFKEDFPTVGSGVYRETGKPTPEKIYEIFTNTQAQTLVYCNGPQAVGDLSTELIAIKPEKEIDVLVTSLCSWLAETYHEDWSLIQCLKHGIGIHHARLPRSVAQLIIELFNRKKLDILLCTSTIIEGVNTSAKNVIIHEQKIGPYDLDFFTFNNVAGRAGRMFKHFLGNVFIFSDPPQEELPYVDIPAISQSEGTSVNILLGMDVNDLSYESYEKVAQFYEDENSPLSIETLKKNPQISPESQIALAKSMIENQTSWHGLLNWSYNPSYEQLEFACTIMFSYFDAKNLVWKSVSSARQLCFLINRLRSKQTTREIIEAEIEKNRGTQYEHSVDQYITHHLNFVRMWATHHFPRLLMCISSIQAEVFKNLGLSSGDYSYYAMSVESLFFDPSLVCLEEYGIPVELSRKIENLISHEGNLDLTLDTLRAINVKELPLSRPEKMFLNRAIQHI